MFFFLQFFSVTNHSVGTRWDGQTFHIQCAFYCWCIIQLFINVNTDAANTHNWVRAPFSPDASRSLDRPFVAHPLIPCHGSPVPLLKFQTAPTLKLFYILWVQVKLAQIMYNVRSMSMESHLNRRPTYNVVWPGSPRGTFMTFLSLPQSHAAFSTPSTSAWVDRAPLASMCHSNPHHTC
jgi:hypothetical protein